MSVLQRAAASTQVLVADLEAPTLEEPDVHHLARVLRLRDGEAVVATDGAGGWRTCAWRKAGRGGELEALGALQRDDPPAEPVAVWLPPLKGERAEWAIAKLTELGVDVIGLLVTDRAAVRLDAGAVEPVLARWRRVAREAVCQSRRTWLPTITGPSPLHALAGVTRCDLAAEAGVPPRCTALAVGPEGGWSPAERSAGDAASIGTFVLRTETAALVAGALLCERRRSRHAAALEAQ